MLLQYLAPLQPQLIRNHRCDPPHHRSAAWRQPWSPQMPTQLAKRMKAEPRDGDLASGSAAGPSVIEAAAKTPITELATHRKGATFGVPGLYATDHHLSVPLDYTDLSKGRIDLFAREVVAPPRAKDSSLPYLLYLQGARGNEAVRVCVYGGVSRRRPLASRLARLPAHPTGRAGNRTRSRL